jgi:hypothetical protein
MRKKLFLILNRTNAKLLIWFHHFCNGDYLTPEESESDVKPPKIASPVSKSDEEPSKPPAAKTARTVEDDEKARDDDRQRERDNRWDRDRDDRYYGSQPQYPPPQPMFTPQNVPKLMALGLLLGIILLFIGSMLTAGGHYVKLEDEDDYDLQRNMLASGNLVAGIGLFIGALFFIIPLLMIRDIEEKHKTLLVLLLAAIIVGFALLQI